MSRVLSFHGILHLLHNVEGQDVTLLSDKGHRYEIEKDSGGHTEDTAGMAVPRSGRTKEQAVKFSPKPPMEPDNDRPPVAGGCRLG